MKLSAGQERCQSQILNQKQLQSLGILELSVEELKERFYQEYLENPMVDYKETGSQSWREESFHREQQAEESGWRKEILEQIDFRQYSGKEEYLFRYLVEVLDEDGFFRLSPEAIASSVHCETEEVEACLDILMKLEPLGIFSSDVRSFLIRQIRAEEKVDEILLQMVEEDLEEVAKGHISRLSRKFSLSTAEIRKKIEALKKFQMSPLTPQKEGKTIYVEEDITITKEQQALKVCLNERWMQSYCLNANYIRMMEESNEKELVAYFQNSVRKYRKLLEHTKRRRDTLLQLAELAADVQKKYLLGEGEKKRLTMTELAEQMGIGISTVHRAVKGKYVRLPKGEVVPFASFFQGKGVVLLKDGEAGPEVDKGKPGSRIQSGDDIKARIRQLTERENKQDPLSDERMESQLREEGIFVKRRTIAKYRQEMGIPGRADRRE